MRKTKDTDNLPGINQLVETAFLKLIMVRNTQEQIDVDAQFAFQVLDGFQITGITIDNVKNIAFIACTYKGTKNTLLRKIQFDISTGKFNHSEIADLRDETDNQKNINQYLSEAEQILPYFIKGILQIIPK